MNIDRPPLHQYIMYIHIACIFIHIHCTVHTWHMSPDYAHLKLLILYTYVHNFNICVISMYVYIVTMAYHYKV